VRLFEASGALEVDVAYAPRFTLRRGDGLGKLAQRNVARLADARAELEASATACKARLSHAALSGLSRFAERALELGKVRALALSLLARDLAHERLALRASLGGGHRAGADAAFDLASASSSAFSRTARGSAGSIGTSRGGV